MPNYGFDPPEAFEPAGYAESVDAELDAIEEELKALPAFITEAFHNTSHALDAQIVEALLTRDPQLAWDAIADAVEEYVGVELYDRRSRDYANVDDTRAKLAEWKANDAREAKRLADLSAGTFNLADYAAKLVGVAA